MHVLLFQPAFLLPLAAPAFRTTRKHLQRYYTDSQYGPIFGYYSTGRILRRNVRLVFYAGESAQKRSTRGHSMRTNSDICVNCVKIRDTPCRKLQSSPAAGPAGFGLFVHVLFLSVSKYTIDGIQTLECTKRHILSSCERHTWLLGFFVDKGEHTIQSSSAGGRINARHEEFSVVHDLSHGAEPAFRCGDREQDPCDVVRGSCSL